MAKQVKLAAQSRAEAGRPAAKKLKRAGYVPAVIYGGKEPPQNLRISAREIDAILSRAASEHILVDLEIADGENKSNRAAIIQEVQHHPIGGQILHVDFHAVSMDEPIISEVPVEPVGESLGVKTFGGVLEQNLHAIEIECLPKDLPDMITVDVSNLNVGESLHVGDLPLPEGVSARNDADLTVFTVAAPRVEVEVAPAAPAAVPEVIREKKEEGGEEKK